MIDWSRVEELRRSFGPDGMSEVLAIFVEETEEALEGIDDLPPEAVAARVHFLKGSAGNMGMVALERLCRGIEYDLSSGSPVEFDVLRTTYRRSIDALAETIGAA